MQKVIIYYYECKKLLILSIYHVPDSATSIIYFIIFPYNYSPLCDMNVIFSLLL